MAATSLIKGIITHTDAPRQTKSNWVMNIVIEQPPYVDPYGTKKGKANHLEVAIFKHNKEDFPNRSDLLKKKIEATVYLNGRQFTTNTGFAYSTKLSLKEYKLIN